MDVRRNVPFNSVHGSQIGFLNASRNPHNVAPMQKAKQINCDKVTARDRTSFETPTFQHRKGICTAHSQKKPHTQKKATAKSKSFRRRNSMKHINGNTASIQSISR